MNIHDAQKQGVMILDSSENESEMAQTLNLPLFYPSRTLIPPFVGGLMQEPKGLMYPQFDQMLPLAEFFMQNSNQDDVEPSEAYKMMAQSEKTHKSGMYTVKNFTNPFTKRKNKVYICSYPGCGREFYKKWNCTEHYKTHSKEKPFVCEECGMYFAQKGSLFKHVKAKSKNGIDHGYSSFISKHYHKGRSASSSC